jgi:hypothetical protein
MEPKEGIEFELDRARPGSYLHRRATGALALLPYAETEAERLALHDWTVLGYCADPSAVATVKALAMRFSAVRWAL